MTDNDLPALFHAADTASQIGQKRYLYATGASLSLAALAALLGVITVTANGTDWAALAATLAFGLALFVGAYVLIDRPERQWYDGRAAAESVKTLAWRYAVGGSDFPIGTADADADFLQRLTTITGGLRHVHLAVAAEGDEITEAMRRLRQASFEERRTTYLTRRVEDQRRWYADATRLNEKRALQWRLTALGAQFSGVVGGVLKTIGTIHVDLLGIAAAVAASGLAWLQTKDHATLAEAYGVTARELALAGEQAKAAVEDDWATAVDNTEKAISREHTLWKARRTSFDA